jgi:hypothetical protein
MPLLAIYWEARMWCGVLTTQPEKDIPVMILAEKVENLQHEKVQDILGHRTFRQHGLGLQSRCAGHQVRLRLTPMVDLLGEGGGRC